MQPADPVNATDTMFVVLTLGTILCILFVLTVFIPTQIPVPAVPGVGH
jgi:hypothetical protein